MTGALQRHSYLHVLVRAATHSARSRLCTLSEQRAGVPFGESDEFDARQARQNNAVSHIKPRLPRWVISRRRLRSPSETASFPFADVHLLYKHVLSAFSSPA